MNPEKYTDRCKGFVQSAQSYALGEGHPRLEPLHVMKVLLDDPQGLAANLLAEAGCGVVTLRQNLAGQIARLSKVSGDGAQLVMAPETAKMFAAAEKFAAKAGDDFVTVERLVQGLLDTKGKASELLAAAGCRPRLWSRP